MEQGNDDDWDVDQEVYNSRDSAPKATWEEEKEALTDRPLVASKHATAIGVHTLSVQQS